MLLCAGITVQDFRDRMISVLLFIALTAALVYKFIFYTALDENTSILLGNYLFIAGQVLFLYIYFSYIRKKQHFFSQVFGLGDLLMMLCMALAFPLPQLLAYFMLSYALGIAFAICSRKQATTIPLAGFMGISYTVLLAIQLLFHYSVLTQFT